MPDGFALVGVLARFLHLTSACILTGIFAFFVLVAPAAIRAAGQGTRERFETLNRRLDVLAAWSLALVMTTAVADFARQALVATGGRVAAALSPEILAALLTETRYGDIWLVRELIWLMLAGLFVFRGPERHPSDRLSFQLASLALSAAGLAVGAASGHAASAPQPTSVAIAVDALHYLAAGLWAGALVPVVLFIRWATREGPGAPTMIVAGVRRFSLLGLLAIATMFATGAYSAVQQVGSVPALLGTKYGHWLMVKLALLLPLLGLALVNRAHFLPRLERAASGQAGPEVAGALARRFGRFVAAEGLFVVAIFAAVAVLGLTTPARHDPVAWPLPFRLAWDSPRELPWRRVMLGSQLAVLGLAVGLLGTLIGRRMLRPTLIVGATAVALGLVIALPPLVMKAYPTTYMRPTVPYTTASIVRGQALYGDHCESCHRKSGTDDGSAIAGPVPPPDLTGRRTADRTVGDLFWRVPHAGHRFSTEQRWDVVNFLRTSSAAEAARNLSPVVSTDRTIVAPDIGYTVGVGSERFLRDQRGQLVMLLVFFRLPESLGRLSRLSKAHFDLRTAGVEILAIPLQDAPGLYRTLGSRSVLFTFAIQGAEDAVATYRLFAQERGDRAAAALPAHMEMLVDRRGYLRARWAPSSPDDAGGWNDLTALSVEIGRLAQEPRSVPVLGEHIH